MRKVINEIIEVFAYAFMVYTLVVGVLCLINNNLLLTKVLFLPIGVGGFILFTMGYFNDEYKKKKEREIER